MVTGQRRKFNGHSIQMELILPTIEAEIENQ